jgi:uncharacterized protein
MDAAARSQIKSERPGAHAKWGFADACSEPPPALLLKGIEEFNTSRYWECHETLETLWRAEPRQVRSLYQGILQIGVGFYHLRRGNYAGAVKVLGRGLSRLQGLPETCQEVRVTELAAAAQAVYNRILELGPERLGEFAMSDLPRV